MRAPEEDVTSSVIANTRAGGVSKAACTKTGTSTPGVDTTSTGCTAAITRASLAAAASRAAPATCIAPPNNGGGRVSREGEFNPFVRFFWSGIGRGREESWVVVPNLVVVNMFLNVLDNIIECADCPGKITHFEVDD